MPRSRAIDTLGLIQVIHVTEPLDHYTTEPTCNALSDTGTTTTMTKGSEVSRQNRIRKRIAAGEIRNLPAQGGGHRPRSRINPNNVQTVRSSNQGGARDSEDVIPSCKGYFYYLTRMLLNTRLKHR